MNAAKRMDLSVDEVLTTTRAVRKRLDLHKRVPRELLLECLELATQAPTGGNSNYWRWIFVEDSDTKNALANLYRAGGERYFNASPPTYSADDPRGERLDRVIASGKIPARTSPRSSCHAHSLPEGSA